MTDADLAANLSNVATPAIALVSVFYVYLEYRRTKRARSSDLAAALISQLESDDELSFACRSLDWAVGPLIVPARYRSLLRAAGVHNDEVVMHSPPVMCVALAPRLRAELIEADPRTEMPKDPRGLIYRYCFDKLFMHLDDIYRLVRSQQISVGDVVGLKYWLERIAKYEYSPEGVDPAEVFQPFVAACGYLGVPRLGVLVGVKEWRVYRTDLDS